VNQPAVSVILPTHNRATFLPEAFASIRGQTFTDWELIVVDDGSTDDTRQLVERLTADIPQRLRYIYQANQGAYGARNTGLDHATGRYVAFFDSDDLWLPHHLTDCVGALEINPDVDVVYGACRIIDHATRRVIDDSTFYPNGKPRPFLAMKTRAVGNLRIISDERRVRYVLSGSGLFCGLQNAVIRRDAFDEFRFEAATRNEAEDQLFVAIMLATGRSFAYFDNIHVIYRVHAANSSGSAIDMPLAKRRTLFAVLIQGYRQLPSRLQQLSQRRLTWRERIALRQRISRDCFWHVGYVLYWQQQEPVMALRMFLIGISWYPFRVAYWKTFLSSLARAVFRIGLPRVEHSA
jgi:glycosyltransferase involved in cell wall biosynthesis